jgi:glycosyltransferase involved in cell wall biosynthesis
VRLVPAPGIQGNLWPAALAASFRANNPDVVHIHTGVWFRAARAARLAGVRRVIHTVHGLMDHEPWFHKPLSLAAAALTDRVIAVSEPLRDDLVRRLGVRPSQVDVVPNGIDIRRFVPGSAEDVRIALGVPAGAPLVGMISRLEPVKNPGLLLEAFARLSTVIPSAHLVYVGSGSERASLELRAQDAGLSNQVRFAGARSDTPELHRAIDVMALSSNAEGSPMCVLEAMATGKPVVSTAVGGVPDQLGNGECGVLTPPGDAQALAEALTGLLNDRVARQALGSRARARVEALYSLDQMVNRYIRLYRAPEPA